MSPTTSLHFDLTQETDRLLHESSIVESGDPTAVILMGGVAVGKTTIRKSDYSEGYVVIDSAELFHHLSRGDATIAFPGPLQPAIDAIGASVTQKALSERRNIVTEIIGAKPEPAQELISWLRALGYKVDVKLITCDLQESLRRNEVRGDNVSAFYAEHFQVSWIVNACKALIKERDRKGMVAVNQALAVMPLGNKATTAAPAAVKANAGALVATAYIKNAALVVYVLGNIATFVKLSFFDGYVYTWWNWIIVLPINEFLAMIWPIYWLVLRPLFGP